MAGPQSLPPRHNHAGHRPAFEATPAVPATFLHQSYAPGDEAQLVLWKHEEGFTVQFFRVAPSDAGLVEDDDAGHPGLARRTRSGRPITLPLTLPIGNWPSGVYYAQLQSGRLTGFAPVHRHPETLGEHRELVVMPTFTWQAYNFRDDDGDGRGDTWYDAGNVRTVRLDRPYLAPGVPSHFTVYDLPFLEWLEATGKCWTSSPTATSAPSPAARPR